MVMMIMISRETSAETSEVLVMCDGVVVADADDK